MTTLRAPFESLYGKHIGFGAAGQVFAISKNIALKSPTLFDNPAPCHQEKMSENEKSIQGEKEIYQVLQRHPHENIVHSPLIIAEGIFLERFDMTLATRLTQPALPVSPELEVLWIQQLASAAAWLEALNIAHGDLRPCNILLDGASNLKLTDFDCAVKFGSELTACSTPFCKIDRKLRSPPAGPQTEQFAIGSCIYNIHFGRIPWSELESPVRVRTISRQEYPPTDGSTIGNLIRSCWDGEFESIAALETYTLTMSKGFTGRTRSGWLRDWALLSECRLFLARERLTMDRDWSSRLRFWVWWTTDAVLSIASGTQNHVLFYLR